MINEKHILNFKELDTLPVLFIKDKDKKFNLSQL